MWKTVGPLGYFGFLLLLGPLWEFRTIFNIRPVFRPQAMSPLDYQNVFDGFFLLLKGRQNVCILPNRMIYSKYAGKHLKHAITEFKAIMIRIHISIRVFCKHFGHIPMQVFFNFFAKFYRFLRVALKN